MDATAEVADLLAGKTLQHKFDEKIYCGSMWGKIEFTFSPKPKRTVSFKADITTQALGDGDYDEVHHSGAEGSGEYFISMENPEDKETLSLNIQVHRMTYNLKGEHQDFWDGVMTFSVEFSEQFGKLYLLYQEEKSTRGVPLLRWFALETNLDKSKALC